MEQSSGEIKIEVPHQRATKHTKERESRSAILEVRFCSFKLNPTKRLGSTLPDLNMYGIYVKEKNPLEEVKPIEWMLLTNLVVTSFEDAVEKVRWYCLRWRIEMFHKVLKSGFKVQECRLSEANRLKRYLTVMSIIAWRLFKITLLARTGPNTSVSTLLSATEWRVLYAKVHKGKTPPAQAPKVADAKIWIARLGGFLARKSDGVPGTTTLWRGWKRLTDLVDGWELAQQAQTCG